MQIAQKKSQGLIKPSAQKDLYEMSLSLHARAILFGWKREFYEAAFLYNVKSFALHEIEGKSYGEFLADLQLSDTSAKRYVRIGKMLAKVAIGKRDESPDEPVFLSEGILEVLLKSVGKNGEHITLRGLDAFSRELEAFKLYLSGEVPDEAVVAVNPALKQMSLPDRKKETIEHDVSHDVGLLKEDVKKFSHSLRDFRNYIHPYQQMSSKFNPDEHTARISWQVLRAAIFQLQK